MWQACPTSSARPNSITRNWISQRLLKFEKCVVMPQYQYFDFPFGIVVPKISQRLKIAFTKNDVFLSYLTWAHLKENKGCNLDGPKKGTSNIILRKRKLQTRRYFGGDEHQGKSKYRCCSISQNLTSEVPRNFGAPRYLPGTLIHSSSHFWLQFFK